MIVVDVETTGTNPQKHSILSIGAIDMQNPENRFYGECRAWNGSHYDKEALAFLEKTEDQVRDQSKQSEAELVTKFIEWAERTSDHTVAAMHPMFDLSFIQEAADRGDINYPLAKRSVDMHSVAVAHMAAKGINYPIAKGRSDMNSDYIMNYVGIPAEPHPHIALNGALWEALSRMLYNRNLLSEFKQYPVVL